MPEAKNALQKASQQDGAAAAPPAPAKAATAASAPAAPATGASGARPTPTASAVAGPPKTAAAAPIGATPAAPKPPPASPTPLEMIGPELRAFLERMLKSGDQVTVHFKTGSFTGRIFRMMLEEGWIALEHVDGRRRACWLIEGGKITSAAGEELPLPRAGS